MKYKYWTTKDHKVLSELFASTPTDELAKIMNRSERSITARATLLGLKRELYRSWRPQDHDLLHKLYPDTPNKVLSEIMGRSVNNIKARASLLGIKKTDPYWHNRLQGKNNEPSI